MAYLVWFTAQDGINLYYRDYGADHPQPDWASAAEAIKTRWPATALQTGAIGA